MIPQLRNFIYSILAVNALIGMVYSANAGYQTDLEKGRQLFYQAVDDKEAVKSAMNVFQELAERYPALQGRARTYIGALTALEGRHSFWVHTKYNKVKKGLQIMDEGISRSPDDIEALFIHGSTCYFLPFLFNRDQDAQRSFKKIMQLLPAHINEYPADLMANVISFLLGHTTLNSSESSLLNQLQKQLAQ